MKRIIKIVGPAIFIAFILSACLAGIVDATDEETMMGAVVKRGKNLVIEADDGDYIVKGKDISKFLGKLVIVTGIVKRSPKGDVIELKTIEDIQDAEQGD